MTNSISWILVTVAATVPLAAGAEPATSGVRGYGIHGTNAQWSIGKAASHGCIRVGDADIGPVWTLMTEGASTVQIVP